MSLTKAHNRMIAGSMVNIKDYGAVGDGTADDTTAIQAAINAADGNVVFPSGEYRITSTITFPTGQNKFFTCRFEDAQVVLDADSTTAIQFGTTSNPPLFTGYFSAYGLNVTQASGRTGNVGISIANVLGGYFQINSISNMEYGLYLIGANNRGCAYNNFDIGSIFGCDYAIYLTGTAGGWRNQNFFRGAKINSAAGTTAVTSSGDENVFINIAVEGTWTTAFAISGRGGSYINNRTEGTFGTVYDFTGVPAGAFSNTFINPYSGTFDPTRTISHAEFGRAGTLALNSAQNNAESYVQRTGSNSGNYVLNVADKYSSAGASYSLDLEHNRPSGTYINFTRGGTDRGSINQGFDEGLVFRSASSTYNRGYLQFGSYYIWVDTSGKLRIKNGAPTSATDGTVVGTQT